MLNFVNKFLQKLENYHLTCAGPIHRSKVPRLFPSIKTPQTIPLSIGFFVFEPYSIRFPAKPICFCLISIHLNWALNRGRSNRREGKRHRSLTIPIASPSVREASLTLLGKVNQKRNDSACRFETPD